MLKLTCLDPEGGDGRSVACHWILECPRVRGTQSLLFDFLILSQMQDTWGQNLFMTSCEFLCDVCPADRVSCSANGVFIRR